MKKLKSILLSICVLGTVCSFTSCGDKWTFCDDEGVSVSNSNCDGIVSDDKKEDIRKELENKYKNVKLTVSDRNVEGLLEKDIPLEKEDDYYFIESVRADELDSIFEVDGHTVETYVGVGFDIKEGFMEYEMYAQYDNDEDNYCFAEVDFISPDFEE